MNSIQCIGNLTAAPELRSTLAGKQVATLRLAIDRRDRAADPVYVDVTVWNVWNGLPSAASTWPRAAD